MCSCLDGCEFCYGTEDLEKQKGNNSALITLLGCPFCNCKTANIKEVRDINQNVGYGDTHYLVAMCQECDATRGKTHLKTFNEFSKYTVRDFRESNLLRAKEEEAYESYKKEVMAVVAALWNERAT